MALDLMDRQETLAERAARLSGAAAAPKATETLAARAARLAGAPKPPASSDMDLETGVATPHRAIVPPAPLAGADDPQYRGSLAAARTHAPKPVAPTDAAPIPALSMPLQTESARSRIAAAMQGTSEAPKPRPTLKDLKASFDEPNPNDITARLTRASEGPAHGKLARGALGAGAFVAGAIEHPVRTVDAMVSDVGHHISVVSRYASAQQYQSSAAASEALTGKPVRSIAKDNDVPTPLDAGKSAAFLTLLGAAPGLSKVAKPILAPFLTDLGSSIVSSGLITSGLGASGAPAGKEDVGAISGFILGATAAGAHAAARSAPIEPKGSAPRASSGPNAPVDPASPLAAQLRATADPEGSRIANVMRTEQTRAKAKAEMAGNTAAVTAKSKALYAPTADDFQSSLEQAVATLPDDQVQSHLADFQKKVAGGATELSPMVDLLTKESERRAAGGTASEPGAPVAVGQPAPTAPTPKPTVPEGGGVLTQNRPAPAGFRLPGDEHPPLPAPKLAEVDAAIADLEDQRTATADPDLQGELASRLGILQGQRRKLTGEPEPEMATADASRAARAAGVRTLAAPTLAAPPDSPAPTPVPVAAETAPAQAEAPTNDGARKPILLESGQPLTTESGRAVKFPALKGTSQQRVKQVDSWLVNEGIAEADSKGDKYVGQMFRTMVATQGTSLSQSDRDSLNDYLFGHENGPSAKHIGTTGKVVKQEPAKPAPKKIVAKGKPKVTLPASGKEAPGGRGPESTGVSGKAAVVSGEGEGVSPRARGEAPASAAATARQALEARAPVEGLTGRASETFFSNGSKLKTRYRVSDIGTLDASHNPGTFARNPHYPEGVQGREYAGDAGKAARQHVQAQTAAMRPDELLDTGSGITDGPPLATSHGIVVGGNQRNMMLDASHGKPRYAAYRKALEERAAEFGLDADEIRAMKAPKLWREIVDSSVDQNDIATLAKLNQSSDTPGTKTKDPLSAAKGRAGQMKKAGDALAYFTETIDNAETVRHYLGTAEGGTFVRKLFTDGVLAPQEKGAFLGADGSLTSGGKDAIEGLLRMAAIGSADVLHRAPQSILAKLDAAIPAIIRANAVKDYGLEADIQSALDLLAKVETMKSEMQSRGEKVGGFGVADYMKQQDMFAAPATPDVVAFAEFLSETPKAALTTALREHAKLAASAEDALQSDDIFGTKPPSPQQARARMLLKPGEGKVAERSRDYGPDLFGETRAPETFGLFGESSETGRAEKSAPKPSGGFTVAQQQAKEKGDFLRTQLANIRAKAIRSPQSLRDEKTVAAQLADLDRIANVDQKISADELKTRAIAGEQSQLLEPPAKYGESAPAFYSRLSRAIDAGPNRGTAEQWSAALSKNVAKGEREWTGIDDFLASNEGKVLSREQVREAFDAGAIKVETTTLSDENARTVTQSLDWQKEGARGVWTSTAAAHGYRIEYMSSNGMYRLDYTGGGSHAYQTLREAQAEAQQSADNMTRKTVGRPKFAQYTEPGGTNYREMLISLNASQSLPDGYRVMRNPYQGSAPSAWIVVADGNRLGSGATPDEAIAAFRKHHDKVGTFTSSHFDQPNVLAHVRLNDRTLPNGEKSLHVEEVQSDWHQKGRGKGYGGDTPAVRAELKRLDTQIEANLDRRKAIYRETAHGDTDAVRDEYVRLGEETEAMHAQWVALNDRRATGVPDAPFKNTSDWAMLAMKHVIDEAVKGGYDRVTWTPGELQANRYDLSKAVDRLTYDPSNGELDAWQHGQVIHNGKYDPKALADVVGKEAADRLLHSKTQPYHELLDDDFSDERHWNVRYRDGAREEPDPTARYSQAEAERIAREQEGGNLEAFAADDVDLSRPVHVLKGDDLKVGGSGMRKFYDEMLPKALKEYGKKIGAPITVEMVHADASFLAPAQWVIYDVNGPAADEGGEPIARFHTEAAARVALADYADIGTLEVDKEPTPSSASSFPSFKVTPELRAVVTRQGQYLYETGPGYGGVRKPTADERAQLDFFSDPTSAAMQRADRAEVERSYGSARAAGLAATKLAENSPAVVKIRALGIPVAADRIAQIELANRRAVVPLHGQHAGSPQVAAQLLHPFRSPTEERMHILYKDKDGNVILHSMETSGMLTTVTFAPGWVASVVARAKQLGAHSVLVAHNHPSGDPTPSTAFDHPWTIGLRYFLESSGVYFDGHVVLNHEKAVHMTIGPTGAIVETPISTGASGPDWTDAPAAHGGMTPSGIARLITRALPADGYLALYMDSQNGPLALEPHALRDMANLSTTLESRTRELGARYVVLAANPETAARLVAIVNTDRTAQPIGPYNAAADPATWSRHIRDVLGLTNDPTIFTSHRDVSLRMSSESLRDQPFSHSVFEDQTPYEDAAATSGAVAGRRGLSADDRRGAADSARSRNADERAGVGASDAAGRGRRASAHAGRSVPAQRGVAEDPAPYAPPIPMPDPTGLEGDEPLLARLKDAIPAIQRLIIPEALDVNAKGTAGTIRHQGAIAFRALAEVEDRLNDFEARIERLPRPQQVAYWNAAEHGASVGNANADAGNALLHAITERFTDDLIRRGLLQAESAIANYIGRYWSFADDTKKQNFLASIMGRRPVEGPKTFLKQRSLENFVDGLRAGGIPATYNYVSAQRAKIAEMQRLVAADEMLKQELEAGRAAKVLDVMGKEAPADVNGDKWVKIDRTGNDPAFTIFGSPEVTHWEAVDAVQYGKLKQLIDDLTVLHSRRPRIGSALGYAKRAPEEMVTKFGGTEGVVMHELGHILDWRYGLGDQIFSAIGKAPTRTVIKGKKAGQQVPDYSEKGGDTAEARARRKTLREELRSLANLRRETTRGVPESKDLQPSDKAYLHSRAEKMANVVEAYVHTPDRFRAVAPGIYDIFHGIIDRHAEMHPLRDIRPSLARDVHTTTTSVGGLVVRGHWYAPKGSAAVWANHLSTFKDGPWAHGWNVVTSSAAQVLLGISGFHATTISVEAIVSDLTLALDNILNRGGASRGTKLLTAAKQIVRAPVAPVRLLAKGHQVMQEMRRPGIRPDLAKIVDAMIAGGYHGTQKSEFWRGDRQKALEKAFNEALMAGPFPRRLWGATKITPAAFFAGIEAWSAPVMAYFVPLVKTGATYEFVAQRLAKLPPNASADAVHRVIGDAVAQMDYRFGQVVYPNHFVNTAVKKWAQRIFLAPGWTFTTLGLMASGARDVAVVPKRIAAGGMRMLRRGGGGGVPPGGNHRWWEDPPDDIPPELLGMSGQYWLALALLVATISGTLTYLYTGEMPEGKDFFGYRDGTLDRDGNPNRHRLPGYQNDVYGWRYHPVDTLLHKMTLMLSFFVQFVENKTYFGDLQHDPDAPFLEQAEQTKDAFLKAGAPLSIQNAMESAKRGQTSAAEKVRNAMGVGPAKREFQRTDAQNKMNEYLARRGHDARTPDEADKGQERTDLIQGLRDKTIKRDSVIRLMRAGELTRGQASRAIITAHEDPLVARFRMLTPQEAQKVYDLGDEREKALWEKPLHRMVRRLRRPTAVAAP